MTPRIVLTVLRNDIGQILLLENRSGQCSLPGGSLEASESLLKVIARYIREDTGFSVQGLREAGETLELGGYTFHGFNAYVAAGKLKRFPNERHLSVSWVSVTMALKISTLTTPSKHFLEQSKWIGA